MNKQQNRLLGLDRIYDLIDVPGTFLETVKRYKLSHEKLSQEEIMTAYQRRGLFIEELRFKGKAKWQNLLAHIPDLEPAIYSRGDLAVHELYELKSYIFHYQALRSHAISYKPDMYSLPDLQSLFDLLDPEGARIPSFRLSPLYSPELIKLDQARASLSLELKHKRHDHLENARRELNIPTLKEEFILARSQSNLIHKISESKYYTLTRESIANMVFRLADNRDTLAIKADLSELLKKIETEEDTILNNLSQKVAEYAQTLATAVKSVKEIGWDFSVAAFALKYDCCLPEISERIELKHARNLPLQLGLERSKRDYQKLDMSFCPQANLITGPNMGGKTSILKCLAQFALMLCRAIPLPAASACLPCYDFVYYNHASEGEDLSSFGSEVVAFCEALKLPGRGLFLLDEFAKGTNPREGEALAAAVISHLSNSRHSTIAATHFTAPAMLKGINQYQIKGIDAALVKSDSDDLHERLRLLANSMNYELLRLDESKNPPLDALRIAKILGLPDNIISRVKLED